MGYDKPDLGFVVHYQAPGSIIAYYQKVGRAGRAIADAYGILLAGHEDDEIHDYFRRTAFPSEEEVAGILGALESSDGMTVQELEAKLNLRRRQIEQALKFLAVDDPAPVLKDKNIRRRTPVEYELPRDRIERLTRGRELEWEELRGYVDSTACLMVHLARALDDPTARPCGRCSVCLGRPVISADVDHDTVIHATRYLRVSEFPLKAKKRVPKDAFKTCKWRGELPQRLRAQNGRVLSRWGDAGWGRAVADDKRAGSFRDELVGAVAEMIRDRWKPDPSPEWVTCVPSYTHPTLVPDFARRLADRLGLPFIDAVRKVRQNQPQKVQQNQYHQCRNLDGAFIVQRAIPASPVLLVDDIVDSGWIMTVIAALLLDAGSGPVWPVALADASAGE